MTYNDNGRSVQIRRCANGLRGIFVGNDHPAYAAFNKLIRDVERVAEQFQAAENPSPFDRKAP